MPDPEYTDDPFRHLPELKGKIIDPETSNFRELDVAAIDQRMADNRIANWRRPDADREATRANAMANRWDNDLWVFAYGSLMWDPGFLFSEIRHAVADGYRRSFCVRSTLGRGSPENPGLMAALDNGGTCQGLAYRIDKSIIDNESRVLWTREMIIHAYAPAFIPLSTPQGDIISLAFVMDHTSPHYLPGLSHNETARYIASGVGFLGPNIQYLENLATQFEILGVHDADVVSLHEKCQAIARSTTD